MLLPCTFVCNTEHVIIWLLIGILHLCRYELVVFTSAQPDYGQMIVNAIDPCNCISHILCRPSTTVMDGIYVKDISRLGRNLSRSIIVDNSPESYLLQPENAIPIAPFFGDASDRALDDTLGLLTAIVRVPTL